jgi:serine recombinase
MATIGFARATLLGPDLETQVEALKPFCDSIQEAILEDLEIERKRQLYRLFSSLQSGDTLMVYRIDRIVKSVKELGDTIRQLKERGIRFVSLTEGIGKDSPAEECFLLTLEAVSSMERGLNTELSEPGREAARTQGKLTGRRPKLSKAQKKQAADLIAQGAKKGEVASHLSVSRSCLHRNRATG